MKNVVSVPATLLNTVPEELRYGKVPMLAQAAANAVLGKEAASLFFYYISEPNGFAPSAREIYIHTFIAQPNMIRARNELMDKGFILFDKVRNVIRVRWNEIVEMGRVAMMLAEAGANPREQMKKGVMHPGVDTSCMTRIVGSARKEDSWTDADEAGDFDAREDMISKIERMTVAEYERWLKTGIPYEDPDFTALHMELPEEITLVAETVEKIVQPYLELDDIDDETRTMWETNNAALPF